MVKLEQELNFTRAAKAIPMAQPALSQAISRLERKLEVKLFERTSRSVEPTAAGRMLARRGRELLLSVQVAVADTKLAGGRTRLRVHVTESSLPLVRRVLTAIRQEVTVPVHQATVPWEDVRTQLLAGRLDIALGSKVKGPGITSVWVADEQVTALMSRSHPLAACDEVTFSMLARHPMVSIDRTMSPWDFAVEREFNRHGHTPDWTRSTAFGAVAGADLVADGKATLLVLQSIADDQPPGRVQRPLVQPWTVDWHLSFRTESETHPVVADALAAARSVLSRPPGEALHDRIGGKNDDAGTAGLT